MYFYSRQVFSTGMTGYVESLTDPSYMNQLLVLTYPLIGNYGVPGFERDTLGMPKNYESEKIHASALVVSEYCDDYSHWNAVKSLATWLNESKVPGICGIDTRQLTKILREKGSMLAKLFINPQKIPRIESQHFSDPNLLNLVDLVSTKKPRVFNKGGAIKLAAIDFGIKYNQVRILCQLGAEVHVLPWDSLDLDVNGKIEIKLDHHKFICKINLVLRLRWSLSQQWTRRSNKMRCFHSSSKKVDQ